MTETIDDTLPAKLELFEITQPRGPTLVFDGWLIAETEFDTKSHDPMRHTFEIYQTRGGAMVAVMSFRPAEREGFEDVIAEVIPAQDDVLAMRLAVMDVFRWEQRARKLVMRELGWKLRVEVE